MLSVFFGIAIEGFARIVYDNEKEDVLMLWQMFVVQL
jgi:hypothetical protein